MSTDKRKLAGLVNDVGSFQHIVGMLAEIAEDAAVSFALSDALRSQRHKADAKLLKEVAALVRQ